MRLKEELGVYTLFQIRLDMYEPRWSFIGIICVRGNDEVVKLKRE